MTKICDSYIPKTGIKTKRISDWTNLNDSNMVGVSSASGLLGLRSFYSQPNYPSLNNVSQGYKYDSVPLDNSSYSLNNSGLANSQDSRLYVNASMSDTGFNNTISPTLDEIKAYFRGFKMCNADGTAPYYKSEVPYTPSTWAEWISYNGMPRKDSTGLEITANGTGSIGVSMASAFKPSTKYLFLYNVVSSSLTTTSFLIASSSTIFNGVNGEKTTGNKKATTTTNATGSNVSYIYLWGGIAGEKIKIKDFRIYELPAGSQIEADSTNLTADQLAAKYTFNGLCPKNWKHLVGNQADIDASKTAVLPTASYDGYTPYKMLYQLATPVEESYTPTPVPTHLGQTIIETDSVVKPTINAVVKVPD